MDPIFTILLTIGGLITVVTVFVTVVAVLSARKPKTVDSSASSDSAESYGYPPTTIQLRENLFVNTLFMYRVDRNVIPRDILADMVSRKVEINPVVMCGANPESIGVPDQRGNVSVLTSTDYRLAADPLQSHIEVQPLWVPSKALKRINS